jgi:hypothetical protein
MKKIFSIILVTTLLVPTFTSAESVHDALKTRTQKRLSASTTIAITASTTKVTGFCAKIDKAVISIETKGSAIETKRIENENKTSHKLDKIPREVETRRNENEIKRKVQLDELSKRATTDIQKTAVEIFITVFNKALADKNAAIDTVLVSHRQAVDLAMSTRNAVINKAVATLKNDVTLAKSQAKTDCDKGVPGDTVRTNLKNAIVDSEKK